MNISTIMKNILWCFFVGFFYATTLSAAELPGKPVGDTAFLWMEMGKAASIDSMAGITNEYLKKYAADYKSDVIAPTFNNLSAKATSDCVNKYCKETVTIPLYTSSKENRWSLATLYDGSILNLPATMRNLGVILQHKF